MPDTPDDNKAPADALQFDKAEVPARRSCSICRKGIQDSYYKIDAKIACEPCHGRVQETLTGGSGTERFVKAAVFGTLAAALGAGIYYAILATTGYEIALISILVGVMVGGAVKKGSNARGGWVYQGLAMFLTYTAIVSAYVPLVIGEWAKHRNDAAPTSAAAPAAKPASAAAPASQPESKSEAEPKPAPAEKRPLSAIAIVVALVVLVLFAYALPILAGFQNIIGLFIIGIGMYQAWKLNKRVKLDIKGPFSIAPTTEATPAGG
jgi:hypothetical protein